MTISRRSGFHIIVGVAPSLPRGHDFYSPLCLPNPFEFWYCLLQISLPRNNISISSELFAFYISLLFDFLKKRLKPFFRLFKDSIFSKNSIKLKVPPDALGRKALLVLGRPFFLYGTWVKKTEKKKKKRRESCCAPVSFKYVGLFLPRRMEEVLIRHIYVS